MHFVGPDQLHGFEERRTTDIYPADFGWTPDWRTPDERIDWWYHNMTSVLQPGIAEITNQLEFDDEVAGEAWEGGPVLLSWFDDPQEADGMNVVIHEFAHKLDMGNGAVDGYPQLPADMPAAAWAAAESPGPARTASTTSPSPPRSSTAGSAA